jgi:hypothetical protein
MKFLDSDLLKNHEDKIKVFVISKQDPIYNIRLRSVFEEYSRNSAAEIEVEFIDRVKDANRLNEISAIYSKSFHEDSVLIDARTESEKNETKIPETTSPSETSADTETETVSLKRIREFPISALFVTSEDGSRIAAWQDEKIITTYLLSAIEGKARKFYFIVDKSEVDDLGEGSPAWKTFSRLLNSQNIQLEPYQISSNKPIPADAEGVAIIGLDVDFDDNADVPLSTEAMTASAKLEMSSQLVDMVWRSVSDDEPSAMGDAFTMDQAGKISQWDVIFGAAESTRQIETNVQGSKWNLPPKLALLASLLPFETHGRELLVFLIP